MNTSGNSKNHCNSNHYCNMYLYNTLTNMNLVTIHCCMFLFVNNKTHLFSDMRSLTVRGKLILPTGVNNYFLVAMDYMIDHNIIGNLVAQVYNFYFYTNHLKHHCDNILFLLHIRQPMVQMHIYMI